MCGSHKGANPHRYEKGPARGDRRREEMGGRKRIGHVYRAKGPSRVGMSRDEIEEFDDTEYKILFALDKRKAYGYSRSCDLDLLMDIQRIPESEKGAFVSILERKLKDRDWGKIYVPSNKKRYIYLNDELSDQIGLYLLTREP